MKVLHIITSTDPAGAEHMLLKLLQYFQSHCQGIESVVVSLRQRGDVADRITELGIDVIDLGMSNSLKDIYALYQLSKIIKSIQPDLVQGWMYHGNLVTTLGAMASGNNLPVIWNIRQCLYDISTEKVLTRLIIQLGAAISKTPKSIIYNCRISKEQHENAGYQSKNAVLIPNGFDLEVFHPDKSLREQTRSALGLSPSQIAIGLVARYDKMKDHANFISAARIVADANPEVVFVLAGRDTNNPILTSQIEDLALKEKFVLLDHVENLVPVLNALDISCSSSWSEGFPNSIGEAMSCGLPCVVTDAGDSSLLVANTGITVPIEDSEALANGLNKLAGLPQVERRQLGERARDRIQTLFSIESIANQYLSLYQKQVNPLLDDSV